MSKKNTSNGRRTVAPLAPAAPAPTFQPKPPEFPTATFMFEGLPCVALIVPEPTSIVELSRIAGEIVRQLMMKTVQIVAEAVQVAQQPGKILGPDEPVPDPAHD